MDGNVKSVDRVLELKFDGGQKKQFREGDVVDINYYNTEGRSYSAPMERGATGKISSIKDHYIFIDASTLFSMCLIKIDIKSIVALELADTEHIEDMRRA